MDAVRFPPCCTLGAMPNITFTLKREISRIARREVRGKIASLKKAAASFRAQIAALKRQNQALEQGVRRLRKASPKTPAAEPVAQDATIRFRFSPQGLATHGVGSGFRLGNVGYWSGPQTSQSTSGKTARLGLARSICQPSRRSERWARRKQRNGWLR